MQNFSYFGHQEDVLEKPPKRKSVSSIDEAFRGVFKESRLDNRTVTQSLWCPALGPWGGVCTLPTMYDDILLRYNQGKRCVFCCCKRIHEV